MNRRQLFKTMASLPLLVAPLTGCLTLCDSRLHGTFISDKQTTLEYLRATGEYTEEQLSKLGPLFGKLKVTYQGNRCTTELNGYIKSAPLRILDRNETSIVLETEFLEMKHSTTLTFTNDGYWVSSGDDNHAFREKFRKAD